MSRRGHSASSLDSSQRTIFPDGFDEHYYGDEDDIY